MDASGFVGIVWLATAFGEHCTHVLGVHGKGVVQGSET